MKESHVVSRFSFELAINILCCMFGSLLLSHYGVNGLGYYFLLGMVIGAIVTIVHDFIVR